MYVDIVLLLMIGLTLIRPIRSTQSILEIRQRRRDNGEHIKTYV